jgi:hypothetical protein
MSDAKIPPEPDLSLATVDDVLDELQKRYDSVMICAVRSRSESQEEHIINWRGGALGAIGLAERARVRINAYLDE